MVAPKAKNLPPLETLAQSLGQEEPLEKEMATHSSMLAWKTPWTEELGELQSTGSQESDRTEHSQTTQSVLTGNICDGSVSPGFARKN